MIRLMELLRDVVSEDEFSFLDQSRRNDAETAIQKGVDCILNCQVVVDGKRTVWCAQHHAKSLAPVRARSYEHPSLSGSESTGILIFLMHLDDPSLEVINAVRSGVDWFQSSAIEGHKYIRSSEKPALVKDDSARPLWARFYEIETNRPIFSDRDGIVKYEIMQIGEERRSGYTWYGNWGDDVLKEYATWTHP